MRLSLGEKPNLAFLVNDEGGAWRVTSLLSLTTEVFGKSLLGPRSFKGKGGSPEMFGRGQECGEFGLLIHDLVLRNAHVTWAPDDVDRGVGVSIEDVADVFNEDQGEDLARMGSWPKRVGDGGGAVGEDHKSPNCTPREVVGEMSDEARRASEGTEFGIVGGGFRPTAERHSFFVHPSLFHVQAGVKKDGGSGFAIHAGAVTPDGVNVGWGTLTSPNPIGIVPPFIGAGQPNGKWIQIEALVELKGREVRLIEGRKGEDPLSMPGRNRGKEKEGGEGSGRGCVRQLR